MAGTQVQVSWQQFRVARELAFDGASNETIARRLGIDVETVRIHFRAVYRKTGMGNRTELAVLLLRQDVVLVPGGAGSKAPIAA